MIAPIGQRFCALAATLALTTVPIDRSAAGPNSEGTLILHAVSQLTYSEDLLEVEPELESCDDATVSIGHDPLLRTACSVVAAFPPESGVEYTSVSFGLDYDPEAIEILDHASFADMEISSILWPAAHQGVVLLWMAPNEEPLVEVYRFLVSTEAVGVLSLIPHPSDGGRFGVQGDEAWEFDPVSDYGRLGFGMDGYLPCPDLETSPVVETSWGQIKWNAAGTSPAW